MRGFSRILIVLELAGVMVEMADLEEFRILIMIVRSSAHRLFRKLIILEKKQYLKDLVVQVETISNKKEEKVEALSG